MGVGWLLNHYLAIGRERSKRLRDFRDAIAVWVMKFESAAPIDLQHLHRISVHQEGSGLRDRCASVREDIRMWSKKRFDIARLAYSSLSQQDIENKDITCIAEALSKTNPNTVKVAKMKPLCDYEQGRQRILKLLLELSNCAN